MPKTKIKEKPERLYFLDNLRVALVILVIIHHLAISYGPPIAWYYHETTNSFLTIGLLGLIAGIDQSFFLGLLFFISAYLTPASFIHKGPKKFLTNRLLRLGIPLLIYSFILNPLLVFFLSKGLSPLSSRLYFISSGPLWFLEMLLIFNICFALWQQLPKKSAKKIVIGKKFSWQTILIFALLIGLSSFLIRLIFPVGKDLLGFQISYLPQYLGFFIAGIQAYHHKAIDNLSLKNNKIWLIISIISILAWPVIMLLGGALKNNASSFQGNLTWQSFIYSLWEGLSGVAISISLLSVFKAFLNLSNGILKKMSQSAYLVYIIHPLILIPISLLFKNISLHPLMKFLVTFLIDIPLCFISGHFLLSFFINIRKSKESSPAQP